MVKFENRVALNKVNRFLKPAQLILFFYCRDRSLFQKRFSKSLISNYKSDNKQSFPTLNDFKIKFVKNKFLVKSLLEKVNLSSTLMTPHFKSSSNFPDISRIKEIDFPPQNKIGSNPLTSVNNLCDRASFTLKEKNELLASSTMNDLPTNAMPLISKKDLGKRKKDDGRDSTRAEKFFSAEKNSALLDIGFLHGNPLLISLENIAFLGHINKFIASGEEDENFYILGGFYENSIIDSEQTKRLISNSENNRAYIDLKNKLNQSFTILLQTLNSHTQITTLLTQLCLQKKSSLQPKKQG